MGQSKYTRMATLCLRLGEVTLLLEWNITGWLLALHPDLKPQNVSLSTCFILIIQRFGKANRSPQDFTSRVLTSTISAPTLRFRLCTFCKGIIEDSLGLKSAWEQCTTCKNAEIERMGGRPPMYDGSRMLLCCVVRYSTVGMYIVDKAKSINNK